MDNKLLLCKAADTKAKDLKIPGVYQIVNADNEVKYVGSTNNLYGRYISHKVKLSSNKHENKKLQQYSNLNNELKFIPTVTANKEEAVNLEQKLLDKLIGNNILCNIATDARNAGKGIAMSNETKEKLSLALKGRIISDETKAKMSASRVGVSVGLGRKHTPEHNAKSSASMMGHLVSDETKAKMSLASAGNQRALGNILSDETKIKQSESKGTSVIINNIQYRSYNHAAQELNVSPQTVLNRTKSNKFSDWNVNGQ